MLKKISIFSSIFISAGILFSGCHNIEGKYYKIKEFDSVKNNIVVEYQSDKIAYGYFFDKVEDYCKSKHRIVAVNKITPISKNIEQVSFSCVIDD